jgi:putative nucleotidyltransferase with HDIG domain
MIPTRKQCEKLMIEFDLPKNVISHSELVRDVSCFLAEKLMSKGIKVNLELLKAAAHLHDLDKVITTGNNKEHGICAANILSKRGMGEITLPIRRHALNNISLPDNQPTTIEEKIIFYADKICIEKVISLEERAYSWIKRFPEAKKSILSNISLVAKLEEEILGNAGIRFKDIEDQFNS